MIGVPGVPAPQGRLWGGMREGISLLGRKSGGPRGCRKQRAGVAFTAGKARAGRVRVYGQVVKSGGPRALGFTGGKGLCGWKV